MFAASADDALVHNMSTTIRHLVTSLAFVNARDDAFRFDESCEESEDLVKIGFMSMAGLFIVYAVFAGLALSLHALKVGLSRDGAADATSDAPPGQAEPLAVKRPPGDDAGPSDPLDDDDDPVPVLPCVVELRDDAVTSPSGVGIRLEQESDQLKHSHTHKTETQCESDG